MYFSGRIGLYDRKPLSKLAAALGGSFTDCSCGFIQNFPIVIGIIHCFFSNFCRFGLSYYKHDFHNPSDRRTFSQDTCQRPCIPEAKYILSIFYAVYCYLSIFERLPRPKCHQISSQRQKNRYNCDKS